MKRRKFIGMIGGAIMASPHFARAQQAGKVAKVGVLGPPPTTPLVAEMYRAFLRGMRESGFIEGQNLSVIFRYLNDARGPFVAAAELVQADVDLIVATGPEIALKAAIGASRGIPVAMLAVNYDPLERGYIASLARPGGNITGVFVRQVELAEKQLDLLTQAVPGRKRLAILWDVQSADQFSAAVHAARSLNLDVLSTKLETPPYDFASAFRTMSRSESQFLLVLSSPLFTRHRKRIGELAIRHRLPTMFIFKTYVEAGGLMSYGVDLVDMQYRVSAYVAKIFNGSKPADLPVEQPKKFELVLNLKTAKALGITFPRSILLRATEVIE